ncbi:MAG: HlyD family efflux transporter periplasmic adaptor subunit [Gammaproteobacteria bacterium]
MQEALLQLARRARTAESKAALGFILVNETYTLVRFRQSVFWHASKGVLAISGAVTPEANAPFVHWLSSVAKQLNQHQSFSKPIQIRPEYLTPDLAREWDEWFPAHALWVPCSIGGFILAREQAWTASEMELLSEWIDIWHHAWMSQVHAARGFEFSACLMRIWHTLCNKRRYVLLLMICLLIPIRMTVLVPGELVPIEPSVIRSPLEGTVERFLVSPNSRVKAGQPLIQLDSSLLSSKLKVAQDALMTAEVEYRQTAQQALFDARSKAQLAQLQGRIAERTTEVNYLKSQLGRTEIKAPSDGIVLMDDPSEWIGKPVSTGERIITIADEKRVEVEAWLGLGDLIDLSEHAKVSLFLNTSPLDPIKATLRYVGHEAIVRPDGHFAYRLRATIQADEEMPRVGLKGTARVSGQYVPLIYWVLRRPFAVLRPYLGF